MARDAGPRIGRKLGLLCPSLSALENAESLRDVRKSGAADLGLVLVPPLAVAAMVVPRCGKDAFLSASAFNELGWAKPWVSCTR